MIPSEVCKADKYKADLHELLELQLLASDAARLVKVVLLAASDIHTGNGDSRSIQVGCEDALVPHGGVSSSVHTTKSDTQVGPWSRDTGRE